MGWQSRSFPGDFGLSTSTYNFDVTSRRGRQLQLIPVSLAIAGLAAIAGAAIVHRAILAALLASRLIRSKADRANHRCENRKHNFSVLFHIRFNVRT
jgi:hypothetical protein